MSMSLLKATNKVDDWLEIAPCISVPAVHAASGGLHFEIKEKDVYLSP